MDKLRARVLVGGGVAVFAAATAFAVTTTASATTSTQAATTGTAALTSSTAKTGTALSIKEGTATIKEGHRDVITGKLTRADGKVVGRRIVELYRYDAKTKKWVPARVKLTHRGGGVGFIVRPLATAQYELVYHGNASLAAARSTPVTVTVTN